MKSLFVTEDENAVMEQFEQEKQNEIAKEIGGQVSVPVVKQGWNEWAGSGVNNQRFQEKVARAEDIKKQKIDELRKKRADHKMRGVVVNTEDRDKKFAHKFWVKDLPHPYNSVEQY